MPILFNGNSLFQQIINRANFKAIQKMIQLINLGSNQNSGDSDSFKEAFKKINDNFQSISKDLKIIVWNSFEDNQQAFKDINDNFEKLENGKSIK